MGRRKKTARSVFRLFLREKRIQLLSWLLTVQETISSKQRTIKKIFVKKGSRKKSYHFSILIKVKYFVFGTLFAFLFICIPLVVIVILQTLPNPAQLSLDLAPQTTKIFDRHGTLLYQIYANQNRTLVSLNDIPKDLQNATIAIEDKNFYKNPGFDLTAIIRAAIVDLKGQGFQGGSTITQQLIKSSLLTPERSFIRKFQEVILAFWAEKIYSKDQILTMYFNQVPYGGTAWGVEAASQTYFGKDVQNLDLAQSAFLAGMPQAPTEYSPFGDNPNLWKKRQTDVLNRMTDLGFISKQQRDEALAEDLEFQTPHTPLLAPHFVMYVKNLLEQKYGLSMVERGGLKVITSLDVSIQNMAQQVVSQEVSQDGFLNLTNGAALVTNPQNGDILAMVGNANYDDPISGQFNVTTAFRQPGSTMKIVTYSAALSNGYTAATILDDSPVSYPSYPGGPAYTPVNYDGRFHGKVPLRFAFGNSINIPAVRTLAYVGLPTFLDLGKKMGLSHLDTSHEYGLSATLGGIDATMLDMATVYGTVANDGARIDLNPILKITDSAGTVIEQKQTPESIQVISPEVAFIISNILSDNTARMMEFGPSSPLVIPGHIVSVKTGTSDDKRDNWTIGYTKNREVTVWVGNNDNSPMSPTLASGITGAAPIWHTIMTNLLQTTPEPKIEQPKNIVTKQCGGRTEYFVKGTENTPDCNYYWGSTPIPSPIPTAQ